MSRLVLDGATTAVALSAIVAVMGSPSHATGGTTCVPMPPLSAAAKLALAADAGQIEEQTNVSADGSLSQRWYDRQDGRSRVVSRGARGKIHSELVTTVNGIVTVDYDSRTWLRTNASSTPFAALSGTAPSVLAHRYRTLIASGRARILGAATVDGTQTIHVRQLETTPSMASLMKREPKKFQIPKGVQLPKSFLKPNHARIELWLDASTYLPVRIRTYENGRYTGTESDAWIARTPLAVSKTKLVIPTGFKREVPGAQGDGAFFEMWTSKASDSSRCHA